MASRQDPTAADIAYAQYSAAEKMRTVGGRVYHRIICKTPLPAPVGGVELILPRAMFRGARAGCVEDGRRPRVPACRPGDAARSGRGAAVVCAVACVRGTRLHGRRHRRVFARVVSAASTYCGRSVQGGGVYKRRQMAYPVAEPRSPMPGIGRRLLEYGAEHYGIREVTVNEQNPQAVGFYEHMGFVTYKRTDRDEQGGPYPLLYMRRA